MEKATSNVVIDIGAVQKSALQKKFDEDMNAAVDAASAEDAAAVNTIIIGPEAVLEFVISPGTAALIYRDFNGQNRNMSIPKARDYQAAMKRGEWKKTHQGYAFDSAGYIVDGQHRLAAQALAKATLTMVAYRKADRGIIDAIDQAKPRKAFEALHIAGIEHAAEKERIARAAMEYIGRVDKDQIKPTVIQVERYVTTNDDFLKMAMDRGRQSTINIAEPCMSITQASLIAYLLGVGKWEDHLIPAFLTTLQAGVEQKENGVIVPMARILIAAKRKDKKTDLLSRDQLISTTFRAARHWARGDSVARFKPAKKGEFIDYRATDLFEPVNVAA